MSSLKQGWRARLLATVMAKGGPRYEAHVEARKRHLFAAAAGRVVEIGAGTGPNLRFLGAATEYIACEPNPYMHPYLRAAMQQHGVAGRVEARDAESLLETLPEKSVDAVVSTLVLCSVDRPVAMLALVRRVLRPGGRLLLLEHVGAPGGTMRCACQHLLSPAFRLLADGCQPIRPTGDVIREAGFQRVELEEFELPLGPIAPHICGWAEN
jgi:SAM-dependent methyltransferase